jgi:hypothetical protein
VVVGWSGLVGDSRKAGGCSYPAGGSRGPEVEGKADNQARVTYMLDQF